MQSLILERCCRLCIPCAAQLTSALSDTFNTHLQHACFAGEGSILSDMDTASWAQALRRTQSRAAFQRLELERLIQSMRAQVSPGDADCSLLHRAAACVPRHLFL